MSSKIPKCSQHNLKCYVKTGLSDGPNKGKNFFICSVLDKPCSFSAPVVASKYYNTIKCPFHSDTICGLRNYSKFTKGNEKWYLVDYRCNKAKGLWCGTKKQSSRIYSEKTAVDFNSNTVSARPVDEEDNDDEKDDDDDDNNNNNNQDHDNDEDDKDVDTYKGNKGNKDNKAQNIDVDSISNSLSSMAIASSSSLKSSHSSNSSSPSPSNGSTIKLTTNPTDDSVSSLESKFSKSLTLASQPTQVTKYDSSISTKLAEVKRALEKQATFMASSAFKSFPADIKAKTLATTQALQKEERELEEQENAQIHLKQNFDAEKKKEREQQEAAQLLRREAEKRLALVSSLSGSIASARFSKKGYNPAIDHFYSITDKDLQLLQSVAETSNKIKEQQTKLDDSQSQQPSLLATKLLPHQLDALKWMAWREGNRYSGDDGSSESGSENVLCKGGILADDMGLGKTLSIIGLICHAKARESSNSPSTSTSTSTTSTSTSTSTNENLLQSSATLIVCPSSVLLQWESEIKKHVVSKGLKVVVFHGQDRLKNKNLQRDLTTSDVVLTTYGLLEVEERGEKETNDDGNSGSSGSSGGNSASSNSKGKSAKKSSERELNTDKPLHSISWNRIVLDEGHAIRNSLGKTCISICKLEAKSRWLVTGTLIHNSAEDINASLRFLRAVPYCSKQVWSGICKATEIGKASSRVDNRTLAGKVIIDHLVAALLLRRLKSQKNSENKPIVVLPERKFITHSLPFSPEEYSFYEQLNNKALKFLELILKGEESKVGFLVRILKLRQFACHPALVYDSLESDDSGSGSEESEEDDYNSDDDDDDDDDDYDDDYKKKKQKQKKNKPVKTNKNKSSSSTNTNNNNNKSKLTNDNDLSNLLGALSLSDSSGRNGHGSDGGDDGGGGGGDDDDDQLVFNKEKEKNLLDEILVKLAPSKDDKRFHQLFTEDYESSKIKKTLELVRDIVKTQKSKVVIVSQWTKLLDLVAFHLSKAQITYSRIDGSMSPSKRSSSIASFYGDWTYERALSQYQQYQKQSTSTTSSSGSGSGNDGNKNKSGTSKKKESSNNTSEEETIIAGNSVMLLSLTAGGVGLNLVAANHLIILDSHWNPALEDQAFDRIYRVGQPLPVFVHQLVCSNTIEERVLQLQAKKREISKDIVDRNLSSSSSSSSQSSDSNKTKNDKSLSLSDCEALLGVKKR